MDIPTYSFEFDGVTFIVEQETGWSVPDCQLVCNKLIVAGAYNPANERQRNRAVSFAKAIVQTLKADGDLGFEWPTPESSAESIAEAFAQFGRRKGLMSSFFSALQDVENLIPADPFLARTPPPEPTSESPSMNGLAADELPPKN